MGKRALVEPLRVIIADDDEIGREHLRAYVNALNRKGASIEVVGFCADGREAVRAACDMRPSVMLLDASMPLLDGVGVVRELVTQLPDQLPYVIFVTAFDEQSLSASHMDALDCLQKPITLALFAAAIERARAALAPQQHESWDARLRAWSALTGPSVT